MPTWEDLNSSFDTFVIQIHIFYHAGHPLLRRRNKIMEQFPMSQGLQIRGQRLSEAFFSHPFCHTQTQPQLDMQRYFDPTAVYSFNYTVNIIISLPGKLGS